MRKPTDTRAIESRCSDVAVGELTDARSAESTVQEERRGEAVICKSCSSTVQAGILLPAKYRNKNRTLT
ncbi:MAG: hypothetical protein HFH85_19375 [Lachnospiraceae bacterium]|nr:hypothetical protein [Lachnospiraceae bacterium]